nr:hypothetical protein [Photobacterium gaetbulicola]
MKKTTLALCLTALGMSLSVNAKTLTLGHSMNLESSAHKGMEIFAEKVKEKSNGEMTVRIYPNGYSRFRERTSRAGRYRCFRYGEDYGFIS